jgi:hypothetical protein
MPYIKNKDAQIFYWIGLHYIFESIFKQYKFSELSKQKKINYK